MAGSRSAGDEEDLLRRLSAGDEAAFATLYSRLGSRVYRFALRMSGSTAIAEDVTQEVFLSLIRQPQRFDATRGSLASFLYGMARNQVLRRLERERPYVGLDETPGETALRPAGDNALTELLRRERVELVWRALLALPPHYREVVVLCELERLSYAEAAAALDCAIGTVRSRLHRGREKLAEKLRALEQPATAARAPGEHRDAR
jgi:RNA polymerase sigma-70 factor (ECF subfamily)